jgi:hypothetical protein
MSGVTKVNRGHTAETNASKRLDESSHVAVVEMPRSSVRLISPKWRSGRKSVHPFRARRNRPMKGFNRGRRTGSRRSTGRTKARRRPKTMVERKSVTAENTATGMSTLGRRVRTSVLVGCGCESDVNN